MRLVYMNQTKYQKIKFNISNYNALFQSFAHCKRLPDILNDMRIANIEKDEISYGTLIRLCKQSRDYNHALELYNEMKDKGIKITNQIINILISTLKRSQRWDDIKEMINELENKGHKFNQPVYNTILSVYGSSGQIELAEELFDKIYKTKTYKIDDIVMSIMAEAYTKVNNIDKVKILMIEYPNNVTLGCLIKCLCNNNQSHEIPTYIE
eukprot:UN27892